MATAIPRASASAAGCGARLGDRLREPARRPIHRAIASATSCGGALQAEAAAGRFASPQAYTPKHLAEKILTTASALTGERKQVTVLFVDVSGFTSLSERLDPEDVHRLMSRAFELMLAEVHRYEGTVNQFLGDGIMALFGAPIAHEDHAQRAVHAALGIRRALEAYQTELAPPRHHASASARASTPASSWSAASAATCAWTTRRSATRPTSRRVCSRRASRGA